MASKADIKKQTLGQQGATKTNERSAYDNGSSDQVRKNRYTGEVSPNYPDTGDISSTLDVFNNSDTTHHASSGDANKNKVRGNK